MLLHTDLSCLYIVSIMDGWRVARDRAERDVTATVPLSTLSGLPLARDLREQSGRDVRRPERP